MCFYIFSIEDHYNQNDFNYDYFKNYLNLRVFREYNKKEYNSNLENLNNTDLNVYLEKYN